MISSDREVAGQRSAGPTPARPVTGRAGWAGGQVAVVAVPGRARQARHRQPPPQPSDTHLRRRSGTLSTGIISQATWPPHGADNGRTLRRAQGAGDAEAEVLIERHVFQLRGFEVGGQPLLIAPPEPRAQQGCADPVPCRTGSTPMIARYQCGSSRGWARTATVSAAGETPPGSRSRTARALPRRRSGRPRRPRGSR
jgi:hypothetical protein